MPTYSYRCTECDNAFDIQQAFTDDSLTVCPVCGGKLRKVFSAVGVTFNGSGFYRNDSRPKPNSAEKSGSSGGEGSKSSDSGKSGDSAKGEGSGTAAKASPSSGSGSTSAPAATPSKSAS